MVRRRKLFQLAILMFSALAKAALAAQPLPPPPPLPVGIDTPPVSFDDAKFVFSVPDFATPIVLAIHMRPYDPSSDREIESFTISYGSSGVTVGRDLVADMPSPDLVETRALALKNLSGDTVIVIYFYEALDCGARCGVVEFAWTVGGKVEKIDQR